MFPNKKLAECHIKSLLYQSQQISKSFDHVVNSLSEGNQPDRNLLNKVGYLYRTTAVYGSGKFGLADRFRIKNRKEVYDLQIRNDVGVSSSSIYFDKLII